MNDLIEKKNILINTLFFESQRIIKETNEYVSSFSPDIFGRQNPQSCDEENYFKLYRTVSLVSDIFSDASIKLLELTETAKDLSVHSPAPELNAFIAETNQHSLLCSVANEQCFSPYLCGIYNALGLDLEKRAEINVGVIRNLTHGFSVNLNEFIHKLEGQK